MLRPRADSHRRINAEIGRRSSRVEDDDGAARRCSSATTTLTGSAVAARLLAAGRLAAAFVQVMPHDLRRTRAEREPRVALQERTDD